MAERDKPTSELLRHALAYWHRIRGDRAMPARADLDPVDIPDLLPYVMLVDVLRDPLDFRFRLLGSEHDEIVSADYRGRRFSELAHTCRGNPIWDEYERVAAEGRPGWSVVAYVGPDRYVQRQFEHCLMPLAGPDGTVSTILVVAAIGHKVADALGGRRPAARRGLSSTATAIAGGPPPAADKDRQDGTAEAA